MATPAAVDQRPLHVQVAAACGWTALRTEGRWKFWIGTPPNMPPRHTAVVPLFTEDWRLIGPLIEKYGIGLERNGALPCTPLAWCAVHDRLPPKWDPTCQLIERHGHGTRPLDAVCDLLVRLGEEGKL